MTFDSGIEMQPPQSFLTTMEDYVKEAPRSGGTLMWKNEPVSAAANV